MREIDDRILARINELLCQLSEKTGNITEEDLKIILTQEMFLAGIFDGELLIGMASIHFRRTMMRKTGIIEDVVVDEAYRGKGIGKELTAMLIEVAKKNGAQCVELTSRPERKAAIAMYENMGFKKRDTNCYRLDILV